MPEDRPARTIHLGRDTALLFETDRSSPCIAPRPLPLSSTNSGPRRRAHRREWHHRGSDDLDDVGRWDTDGLTYPIDMGHGAAGFLYGRVGGAIAPPPSGQVRSPAPATPPVPDPPTVPLGNHF